MSSDAIAIDVLADLSSLSANAWNSLGVQSLPFLRHEFLRALETEGCLGEELGWLPQHLCLRDAQGQVQAAAPLYLKTNSYGEFVFDWSWADAYQRAGLRYYPKLVSAAPYTPATGSKLLLHPQAPEDTGRLLAEAGLALARRLEVSSLHWLFTPEDETQLLESCGLLRRVGCQFHWHNAGYADFPDFLATLSAAKRKNIKRERRRVAEQGIRFERLHGDEISDEQWHIYHQLYRSTFAKHGGWATLSEGFFRRIGELMPEAVLLVMAYDGRRPVAAAFDLVGTDTLYGRHWGCFEDYHSLHFEACYYQGLDYCIERGLQRFEPGAQGEHKVARGFLPTETYSAHWLADPRFQHAVADFVRREQAGVADYAATLEERSPYRKDPGQE